jgi:hypothetical protein
MVLIGAASEGILTEEFPVWSLQTVQHETHSDPI